MKRTRNEIRERRGKMFCIIAIVFPLILLGVYFLYMLNFTHQFGESLADAADKVIKNSEAKRIERDKKLIYSEFLRKDQIATFNSTNVINDETAKNSFQFQAIDSSSINYSIIFLQNEELIDSISGIAILDSMSILNDNWKIKNSGEIIKSAFRFTDNQESCEIEILINKSNLKKSISLVNIDCENLLNRQTLILKYKI